VDPLDPLDLSFVYIHIRISWTCTELVGLVLGIYS
jgi:hypothetical protein